MSIKDKAVQDIKKIGIMFSGLVELGKELETMASLENALMEVKIEHEKLLKLNVEAASNLESLNVKVAEQEAQMKVELEQHKKSLIAIANEEKEKFLVDQKSVVAKCKKEMSDYQSSLEILKNEYTKQKAIMVSELEKLSNDLVVKEAKRKEINEVLASLKGSI